MTRRPLPLCDLCPQRRPHHTPTCPTSGTLLGEADALHVEVLRLRAQVQAAMPRPLRWLLPTLERLVRAVDTLRRLRPRRRARCGHTPDCADTR